MSRKSKRKKKKRKQKEVPTTPPPVLQPIPAKSSRHGLFLTILGLVLTAIGLVALIELFPRLSATASSPTDLNDPLTSSKFAISNDGYLRVTEVTSACFLWRVEMASAGRSSPNIHFTDGLAEVAKPPESRLNPTEAFTVPCTGSQILGSSAPYAQPILARADLAIVVYYRPWPFTFYRDRRMFRFVSHAGKQGEITWEKQPSGALEPDFDKSWTEKNGEFVRKQETSTFK